MARKKLPSQSTEPANVDGMIMPMLVDAEAKHESFASSYSRRETNEAPQQSYPNLDTFINPFKGEGASIDTRDAIRTAVKAYWAFPLLRNVVEVMGELSNSSLYLKGGNKATRAFVQAWWEKINLWQLKEQFFREWFRSANTFIYRLDGNFTAGDLRKMSQAFAGFKNDAIPVKYIILNPESISAKGVIGFNKISYVKLLSAYELEKLRNPTTQEEKQLVKELDAKSLKDIQSGESTSLSLDPARLSVLLYKAQPYEPMGVPMCFGVLKDIEAKLELKRIDLSIARTTDRALLLLTVGETPNQYHKGGSNINPNTIVALQNAFANEGVARTLIADYTVKGDWLIPDINKILGPEKYIQLDKDINVGLNAILFGEGEKFANTSIKVQIFIERLKEARNAFLHNFLQPEINKVCKIINAKSVPQATFEDLSLKDELQYAKIFVSLAQLGLLTPEELFEAMDSGKMPINEESIEHQRAFKELRDEGLYLPVIGGAADIQKQQLDLQSEQIDNQYELGKETNRVKAVQAAQPKASGPKGAAGRPKGSIAPKTSTTPTPVGSGKANMEGFSLALFKDYVPAVSDLHNAVEKGIKKQWNIRKLNDAQASIGKQIVEAIMANEPKETWGEVVKDYLIEPKEMNTAAASQIDDLRIAFDVDSYTAGILRLTKTTKDA